MPENQIYWDVQGFDTFYDKTLVQDPESILTTQNEVWTSVMWNRTLLGDETLRSELASTLYDHYLPNCFKGEPCAAYYLIHRTLPTNDDDISGTKYILYEMPFIINVFRHRPYKNLPRSGDAHYHWNDNQPRW